MKKLTLLALFFLVHAIIFSQIGPKWCQMLPENYDTSPAERDQLTVRQVPGNLVKNSESLVNLWDEVNPVAFPIDKVVGGEVDNTTDFSGNAAAFWDNSMLYILFKVTDQEIEPFEDYLEISVAPYAEKYDPGREIHPTGGIFESEPVTIGPYDYLIKNRHIPGSTYVAMSKYGLWMETGAHKAIWDIDQTGDAIHPMEDVYYLKEDSLQVLIGREYVEEDFLGVYETRQGGYFYLAGIPWEQFHPVETNAGIYSWDMPAEGVWEAISLAVSVKDYDDDNYANEDDYPEATSIWGGTESVDAYWAVAYHGALAAFEFGRYNTSYALYHDNKQLSNGEWVRDSAIAGLSPSYSFDFILDNTGIDTLTGLSASIDANHYSFPDSLPSTLYPGEQVSFSVRVGYDVAGLYHDTLRLACDQENMAIFLVLEVFEFNNPDIELSLGGKKIQNGGRLDYGAVTKGDGFKQSLVGIKNKGKGTLLLDKIDVVGSEAFSVTDVNNASTLFENGIAEGETSYIIVNYSPANIGEHTATLVIESNALVESEYYVNLSGKGVHEYPVMLVEVDGESHDSTKSYKIKTIVGETGNLGVVIRNDGMNSLITSNINMEGDGYRLMNYPVALTYNQQSTIYVEFNPDKPGLYPGKLMFSTNDPAMETCTIKLQGKASLTGIQQHGQSNLTLFPVPASESLHVKGVNNLEDKPVYIYNMLGQKIIDSRIVNGKIDISSLQKGLYLLKVKDRGIIVTHQFSVR